MTAAVRRVASDASAGTRPEYEALVTGLPALMRDFDCEISPTALHDVGVFIAALECVDRVLDPLPTATARRALTSSVLAAIAGEVHGTGELAERLNDLHVVLRRRERVHHFYALARAILGNTEHMRTTRRARDYLDAIEREGVLMVELALLFLDDAATPRFAAFLRAVGGPANLLDKLLDMRDDRRRGELALEPSAWLHARVLGRMLRHLPSVATLHPRPRRFLRWGVDWVRRMRQG